MPWEQITLLAIMIAASLARRRKKLPGAGTPLDFCRWGAQRGSALSTREFYLDKANDCLAAANVLRAPEERAALNQIAQAYIRLANHVSARREPGVDLARRQRD